MELIVAVYDDWGIGCSGTQPVALSVDRKFFRETTRGATVIAGRKTVADFPGQKPLPGRKNIVLSRSGGEIPGFVLCDSPEKALQMTENDEKVFVIGGGVSAAGQIILDSVQKAFVRHAFPSCEETRFELATLGNDAGIIGAAMLCR